MNVVYQVLGYVVTNAVSLGAGAVAGYWFGPSVVALLKGLLAKLASKVA